MKFIVVAVLSGLAGMAAAQGSLPSCASSCLNGYGGCQQFNVTCICSDTSFIAGLACCVSTSCDAQEQEATLQFAEGLCSGVGVTNLPTTATCSSTGAATGSSTTGAASTGTASSGTTSSGTTSAGAATTTGSTSSVSTTTGASATSMTSTTASSSSGATAQASTTTAAASSSTSAAKNAAAMETMGKFAFGLALAGMAAAL